MIPDIATQGETRKIDEIVWRKDLYPEESGKRWVSLAQITEGDCPLALANMVAGYIEKGAFCTDSSVAMHFFRQHRERKAVMDTEPFLEAEFRDAIAQAMKADGWQVATEDFTSQGRIDILARRGDETRIIEVKMTAKSNDMAHALGQLLFYSKFHPGASLWVASPERPDLTTLAILASYGVHYQELGA